MSALKFGMVIELPPGVTPSKPALVRRDRTSIVDVYRHYDPDRADRKEPAADATNAEEPAPTATV